MIRSAIDTIDQLTEKLVRLIESLIGRIPRKFIEILVVVLAALAVYWLYDKNFYYAIGAVVAMFALLFLLVKPILLVYTIFALIPVAWINLLGRRFRVATFLTLLALGFYALQVVVKKQKLPREPVLFAYLGYIGTCAISLINSVDIGISFTSTKYFLLSMMFAFTLVLAIEEKRQFKILVYILLAWGAALSLLSVLQSAVSIKFYPAYYFHVFGIKIVEQYSVQGIRRASGTFESGPRYAMYLLGPIAVAVAALWRNLYAKRAFWLGLLMLYILGLLVSFTRAAMLLAVVYFFLYNFFDRNWRTLARSMVLALVVVIVAVTLVYLVVPQDVTGAMMARFQTEDDELYLDRFTFLYNALHAFMENPVIGLGIGTYALHSWDMMQKYPVPWGSLAWDVNPLAMPQSVTVHNDYGRMLAETGMFSLVFFILIFVFAFRNFFWVLKNSEDEFYKTCSVAFGLYLGAMIPYWFFHEYIMMEPYTSMIPIIMSVLLKKLAAKEVNQRKAGELISNNVPDVQANSGD